jgi:hypothetical protein
MERKFEEIVEAASKATQTLGAQFEAEHAKNIAELRQAWDRAKSTPDAAADLSRLFGIGHDIKGQGGSFDRPILTQIAGLLCTLTERLDKSALTPASIDAIECHVAALELVTRRNITGYGGAGSAQLLEGLKKIAATVGRDPR